MACLERVDSIVVGGGQAGLAVGYHLRRRGLPFVILDAADRVGDAWRNRWDSLRLFSTRRYSQLDGMPLPGPPHGFPSKDEIANYLEAYAEHFALPVRSGVSVDTVTYDGRYFLLRAGSDTFAARNVVVAMSTDQVPWTPPFASALDPAILQMHSAQYRTPSQLQSGAVLVVGAGNSGGEIAMELASERSILLAGDIIAHVPVRVERVFARYVVLPVLFRFLAHRVLTVRTPMGRHQRHKLLTNGSPLVRVKPRDLDTAGVRRVARITGVRDGRPQLADDTTADVSEHHLVHRVSSGLLVDRPARLPRRSPRASTRHRASPTGPLLRRPALPLRNVLRLPARCQSRRRLRRQPHRTPQDVTRHASPRRRHGTALTETSPSDRVCSREGSDSASGAVALVAVASSDRLDTKVSLPATPWPTIEPTCERSVVPYSRRSGALGRFARDAADGFRSRSLGYVAKTSTSALWRCPLLAMTLLVSGVDSPLVPVNVPPASLMITCIGAISQGLSPKSIMASARPLATMRNP